MRIEDRDPSLYTYLVGCKTDSGCVVHRFDHVLGKDSDRIIDFFDWLGGTPENGVSKGSDRIDGHLLENSSIGLIGKRRGLQAQGRKRASTRLPASRAETGLSPALRPELSLRHPSHGR